MAKKTNKPKPKSYNSKKTGDKMWTNKLYLPCNGIRIPTGKTTIQEAEQWGRENLGLNGEGQRQVRRQQRLRKAPLEQHLERWRKELGDSEWNRTKVARIRKLLEWCGFVRLSDLDARQVGRVLDHRVKTKKMALKTMNAFLIEARSFGDFLVGDGILSKNPIRELNKQGKPILKTRKVRAADRTRRRRYLKQEELKKLLQTVESQDRTIQGISATDRLMAYRLAASSGLRKSEIGALQRGWFDLELPVIYLNPEDSKNAEGGFVALPDHLVPKLRTWLETKPMNGPVLPISKKRTAEMIAEDLKAADIPVVDQRGLIADFHSLRYSFIALLALNGVDIAKVSEMARHASIELTAKTYLVLGLSVHRKAANKMPEF